MNVTPRRTEIIIQALCEQHDMQWVAEYGEPGYGPADKGVLFANWNNVSKRVQQYLKAAGYSLEWEDEWYLDYDNGRAWRTSPNSYDWQCQVAYGDGFVLTPDDDVTDWIDLFRDDYHRALPSRIKPSELEALGWTRVEGNDFENGWFPGQNDNPETIYRRLITEPNVLHVLFRLMEISQFYVKFEVWVMYDEEEATNG